MKRRDFLKGASAAGVLPFMLGGYSVKAYAGNPMFAKLLQGNPTNNIFVIIQMSGGNDGLNMVIPRDQYSEIMAARANIAIPEAQVLPLTTATGLNPAMTPLQRVYNEGKLVVCQNIGYPNPDFSHFRSTDIWLTGADYYQTLPTGWLGRYLNDVYPTYPTGFPNAQTPDPIAIQIGSSVTTSLDGPNANFGLAFSDPTSFYNIVGGQTDPTANTRAGHELSYVRLVGQELQQFSVPVKAAATAPGAKNLSKLWPAAKSNPLADQLRIIASLIGGGLQTSIYMVNVSGFDTHANQLNGGGGYVSQTSLLSQLAVGIEAFLDDLTLMKQDNRVVGMTMSEFGRRIKSNSSGGTDHGAAAPLFVFGTNVNGLNSQLVPSGIIGANPVLPANATVNDNVAMQYDFRQVYAGILRDWLGVDQAHQDSVLYGNYQALPVIKGSKPLAVETPGVRSGVKLGQNFPNPVQESTTINFFMPEPSLVKLRVIDASGNVMETVIDKSLAAGDHSIRFNASSLAAGSYLYDLQIGEAHETRKMEVVR